jgi:Icc protein
MTVVAQITDTHLDGGATTRDRFLRVVEWLRGLEPPVDAIVLTGDIIQDEHTDGYAVVRDALAGIAPVIACPGNSDDRIALREAFPGSDSSGTSPVNTVLEIGNIAIVALDSSVPGAYVGLLDEQTLAWLSNTLNALSADRPVLIALHHPPADIGHPTVDGLKLGNPEALGTIIAAHPNVVGTVVGHTHGALASMFAGRPLIVAPGVSSELRLSSEVSANAPSLMDSDVPPGIALHLIEDDGRLITSFRTITIR